MLNINNRTYRDLEKTFRICNNSRCSAILQALGCPSPAYILPARNTQLLLTWGLRWGRQAGATQKKGSRGSFDIIGTFYSSGHYTLTFLERVSASSSVSVENVHLQNGVTVLPSGRAATGTGSYSSSTKPASGAWTQETALSRSACWMPLCGLGGQHPSLAARSLVPSLACICCG